MWTKALWPRAAWSPRRLSMRPHALLVPQVLLEVSLDRKPTIGEFLDKARSLHLPPPPPRVHACPCANSTVPQVEWDDKATGFACSATDGFLYVHELLGV